MEEIRKSREEEQTILSAKFRLPIILHILMPLSILMCIIMITFTLMTEFIVITIILSLLYILLWMGIRRNRFEITNKVIKGRYFILFGYKYYSYRLDMIDNVQTSNVLGLNQIKIQFTQGYQGKDQNTVCINNIADFQKIAEELNKIIANVRNDKDVQTELSLKHTQAIESIGSAILNKQDNSKEKDYIYELKQLKELLDGGVITKEEFENKKKNLL